MFSDLRFVNSSLSPIRDALRFKAMKISEVLIFFSKLVKLEFLSRLIYCLVMKSGEVLKTILQNW